MSNIEIEKADQAKLDALGVKTWSPWTCEKTTFDWSYSERETCYILEGHVIVKTQSGNVEIKQGDLVTFPQGLQCTWQVLEPIRKVYKFG